MVNKNYKCLKCGKSIETSDDKIPKCCGQIMEQIVLDNCTQPHSAEYSGPFEEDEPCDEGR